MNSKFITFLFFLIFILSNNISAQWYQQNTGITNDLYTVSFFDENHGWAAGFGVVLRTTNGGSDWIVQISSMPDVFVDIQSLDINIGKVMGMGDYNSVLLATTDGGNLWWYQSPFNFYQFAVFFINQNIIQSWG